MKCENIQHILKIHNYIKEEKNADENKSLIFN